MMAKVGSIPTAAILLVALLGAGLGAGFARAQNACLGAPNAPAPPGSHWYYRTDQSAQHKCWYVRPLDQAIQATPAQEKPAAAIAAAGAARATASDGAHWTDPPPSVDTSTMSWPDPPSLPAPPPVGDAGATHVLPPSTDTPTQGATAGSTSAVQNTHSAPAVAKVDEHRSNEQPAGKKAADPAKPTAPQRNTSAGMIWAGVIALLIAGIFLRRAVTKSLGGRRATKAARREPHLIETIAAQRPMPTLLRHSPSLVPGHAEADHRIGEVEDALRKLAQRLRRRRSTPFKSIDGLELRVRS
jgi:hypothetical protein